MDFDERLLAVWREAEADLPLAGAVRAHGKYVLVPSFGARAGTLCSAGLDSADVADLKVAAAAIGAGYSVLGEFYLSYDRQQYIDMLDDWGWFGNGPAPEWYSGTPWTT